MKKVLIANRGEVAIRIARAGLARKWAAFGLAGGIAEDDAKVSVFIVSRADYVWTPLSGLARWTADEPGQSISWPDRLLWPRAHDAVHYCKGAEARAPRSQRGAPRPA